MLGNVERTWFLEQLNIPTHFVGSSEGHICTAYAWITYQILSFGEHSLMSLFTAIQPCIRIIKHFCKALRIFFHAALD